MLRKILAIGTAIAGVLRRYPAAASGLLTVAVALLARLGYHVTADQLTAIVVPLVALTAAIVHATVTPTAKLSEDAPPAEAPPAG